MHFLMMVGLGLVSVLGVLFAPTMPVTIFLWLEWWWEGKVHNTPVYFEDFWLKWAVGLLAAAGVAALYGIGCFIKGVFNL